VVSLNALTGCVKELWECASNDLLWLWRHDLWRETSVLSAENPVSFVLTDCFTAEGWECIIGLFKEAFGCWAGGMWAVTELLWCPVLPQLLTTASLAQLKQSAQLWTQRTAIFWSISAYVL